MPTKIEALLKSRRFWTAVLGVVVVAFKDVLGLDETETMTVGGILITWIIGDSVRETQPRGNNERD